MIKLANKASDWIKEYTLKNNRKALVTGVSGGVDSAVVSTLNAMTGIRSIGVIMPCHSKANETTRGWAHMKWLMDKFPNVEMLEIDLTATFDAFSKSLPVELRDAKAQLSFANDKSRLRMTTLYHVAGYNDGLVVGTGNKVEDFGVGFFTKYGDGGVDLSPIAKFTKTEVRAMAKALGINKDICEAIPTDGLWDDARSDESQLGATYEEFEWIMKWLDDIRNCRTASTITARQNEVLTIYNRWNKAAQHKLNPIPIFER